MYGLDNIKKSKGGVKKSIEKITFKVVQIKFTAMHITNHKLSWYITVGNTLNIFMEHDLNDIWHTIW